MRVGVHLPQVGPQGTRDRMLGIAKAAEDGGFATLWASDHVVIPVASEDEYPYNESRRFPVTPDTPFLECLATLAFVAAATTRIRVGTSALVPPVRNFIITAKALTTIDKLSEGRLTIALGPGWWPDEFRALGFKFRGTGKHTDEFIRALDVVWGSPEPEFNGEFIRFQKIGFEPKPVQIPRPPILIAGLSDAALQRAARLGDGWHPAFLSPAECGDPVRKLHAFARDAGRDPASLQVSLRTSMDIRNIDPGEARDVLKAYEAAGVHEVAVECPARRLDDAVAALGRFSDRVLAAL